MNIFFLHHDPIVAANYHCDQHKGKMILESAQLMCTVLHTLAKEQSITVRNNYYTFLTQTCYKPTHVNHPCTKWLLESPVNIKWLRSLARQLNSRIGLHASYPILEQAYELINYRDFRYPNYDLTPIALAMPDHIANNPELLTPVAKYQEYYREKAWEWYKTAIINKHKQVMSFTDKNGNKFLPDFMTSCSEFVNIPHPFVVSST